LQFDALTNNIRGLKPVTVNILDGYVASTGNVSGGDCLDLVVEPSPFTATRYASGELPVETQGQAEFVAAYGTDVGFADSLPT